LVGFVRTACVIAVAKARDTFEPFLDQVGQLASSRLIIDLPFEFHHVPFPDIFVILCVIMVLETCNSNFHDRCIFFVWACGKNSLPKHVISLDSGSNSIINQSIK
jgi:hypothetical protein